uniref:Rab-GAP TBC domain-containing protein n=1 Tax=Panagrellus redivivus TaxID=6233 RepID=A0A7E4UQU4_PANRE
MVVISVAMPPFCLRFRPPPISLSTTPDSLIESGSDSASLVKDARPGLVHASGSEFGSLTSCQIGHDDDLDSGVGGPRQPLTSTSDETDPRNTGFFLDSSFHGENLDESVGPFEIRRVELEVKRRTSSSCLLTEAATPTGFDPDTGSETTDLDMLSSAAATPAPSHGQYPSAYAPSRSMSSLHRNNASPQRIRKKWKDFNGGNNRPAVPMSTVIGVGGSDYGNLPPTAASTPGDPPAGLPYHYQHSGGPSQNHVYQQPGQHHNVGGISSSVSLHGLRSINNYDNMPSMNATPKNSFAPIPSRHPSNMHTQGQQHGYGNSPSGHASLQGPAYGQQHQQHAGLNDASGTFDRANASRNSLTKKFMNMSGGETTDSSSSPKNWTTPPRFEQKKASMFGSPVSQPLSIHRRQSERAPSSDMKPLLPTTFGCDTTPRRMFTRNPVNNGTPSSGASGSPSSLVLGGIDDAAIAMRRRTIDRSARRRQTVSAYADYSGEGSSPMSGPLAESTPMSPPLNVLQEEDYESSRLHNTQSPNPLRHALGTESGSRTTLRKNSDFGSTLSRVTPSSSRSNLRGAGSSSQMNMNRSNQALNKLIETRSRLKKSQENLAYAVNTDAEEPQSPTSSSAMARSRSIGNLRGGRASEAGGGAGFGGYDENLSLNEQKRHMARSVTSLHNNNMEDGFVHPDECTLQNQYGAAGRRQSTSRFSSSIRNLEKLSNSDLTNANLYDDAGTNDSNTLTAGSTGATPYFSTTLPKSIRKGPVSKRVQKATAAARDQTSESDSNTSDQTAPNGIMGAYLKQSPAAGFRITASPLRSASSVEAGRVAMGRRQFDPVPARKGNNYLIQKFSQLEAGGESASTVSTPKKPQEEFENGFSNLSNGSQRQTKPDVIIV